MPQPELDFLTKADMASAIDSIRGLLSSGVFQKEDLRLFQEPAFVSIIIKANDLLQKMNLIGERLTFNEDIPEGDITDLVNTMRNAACHISSPENLLDRETQIKFVFNMVFGKANAVQLREDMVAKTDYEDDIAVFYGRHRFYLKRHLVRLVDEAATKLKTKFPDDHLFQRI